MAEHETTSAGRHSRRRRWLVVPLLVALIPILAVAAYGLAFRPVPPSGLAPAPGAAATLDAEPPARDTAILLAGVDRRPGDIGRSDTLMLLKYDSKDGRLHLLSIPRDTEVDLPGHGRQKINAAYVFGGVNLMLQAASDLTGLKVDRYVTVDMQGFEKVVDALGGVDIDIKRQMDYDDASQGLSIHFTPGVHHLNGHDALSYVRWRGDPRADLGRIDRQQGFLTALAQQALTPAIIPRLPALITSLRDSVKTDIPVGEQLSLAVALIRGYHNGLTVDTVPGRVALIDHVSYVIADQEQLKALIAGWSAPATN